MIRWISNTYTYIGGIFAGVFFLALPGCVKLSTLIDPSKQHEQVRLPDNEGEHYGIPYAYEHKVRSDILDARGDKEGAMDHMAMAIQGDPYDFLLRVQYAKLLIEAGHYERAKLQLAKAILLEPTSQLAWVTLADWHMAVGNTSKALPAAEHGIRVDSKSAEALIWLGDYYLSNHNEDTALEYYRRAVDRAPKDRELRLSLGNLLSKTQRHEESMVHLSEYFHLGGKDGNGVVALAKWHVKNHRVRSALEILELVLETNTPEEEVRIQFIELLLEQGLDQRALTQIDSFTLPLDVSPEKVVRQVQWYVRAGDIWAGRDFIVDRYGTFPEPETIRYMLATIEVKLTRYEVAAFLLENSSREWSKEYVQRVEDLKAAIPIPTIK